MRTLCLFGTAALALVACTQDYGQFGFGGGGTGASTSSSTTTSSSSTTTSTASSSSGGGEGGATMTTTTTSSGGGMGGAGGAPPVVSVDCDGAGCAIEGAQRCCWDIGNEVGSCESDGDCGNDLPITCQVPADCPGQICCADRANGELTAVRCADNCSMGGDRALCDPTAQTPCASGTCTASMLLPAGFFICL